MEFKHKSRNSLEHLLTLKEIYSKEGLNSAINYDLNKTLEDAFDTTYNLSINVLPFLLKLYFISSYLYNHKKRR